MQRGYVLQLYNLRLRIAKNLRRLVAGATRLAAAKQLGWPHKGISISAPPTGLVKAIRRSTVSPARCCTVLRSERRWRHQPERLAVA